MIAIAAPLIETRTRTRQFPARRLLTLLGIPLICFVFMWIGIRAAHAYFLAQDMRQANDILERNVHTVLQQNQRIEREVKALQTPAGIVRAARQHGLVMPGEVRLRIK